MYELKLQFFKFKFSILIIFLEFKICSLQFENNNYICTHNFADMVKLVDMPDLGSGAARRVGSSPIIRTKPLTYK
jgi:hypothetical protein